MIRAVKSRGNWHPDISLNLLLHILSHARHESMLLRRPVGTLSFCRPPDTQLCVDPAMGKAKLKGLKSTGRTS